MRFCVTPGLSLPAGRSAFILHSAAVTFNDDDLAMMNNPVEDSACYRIVIVENHGPLLENPVGCEEGGSALVSCGYNLEKQIGPLLVDGNVTQFVDAQNSLSPPFLRYFGDFLPSKNELLFEC